MTTTQAVLAKETSPKPAVKRSRRDSPSVQRPQIDRASQEWQQVVCDRYFNPYDRLD